MKQLVKNMVLTLLVLLLAFTAFAQPNWTVNAREFAYSMTITGQLSIDGSISTDINDKVAAFIDGQCRGVTNVKHQTSLNEYFAYLMIYSNDPNGEVSFKIYDASENKELDAVQTITYGANDIIGSVSDPFLFSTETLSSDAKILTFTIPNQVGETIFNGDDVYLQDSWDGDLSNIVAHFTISEGAKSYIGDVEQVSGQSSNDFTNPVQYTIESADGSTTRIYTIHITIGNDIPSDIILSNNELEENLPNFTFIGTFHAINKNPAEEHDFSLVNAEGANNGNFYIHSRTLYALRPFNYEEKSNYTIYVRADDNKGGVVEKFFNIKIIDVNDAPSAVALVNANTPVNVPANTTIGNLLAIDEDAGDTHIFALVNGDGKNDADNNKFKIEGEQLKSVGEITLVQGVEYSIVVKCVDNGGAFVITPLTISSENQGSPPHSLALSNSLVVGIDNPPVFVGTLTAQDADQDAGLVFSLPVHNDGPDNGYFILRADSLFLNSPEPVTDKESYQIVLAATDDNGNQITRQFTINVREKMDQGDFYLSKNQIPENRPIRTVVGFFDSDKHESSKFTYSLSLEVDLDIYGNNHFTINGRTLLSKRVFDFEEKNALLLRVEITEGENTINKEVEVFISTRTILRVK